MTRLRADLVLDALVVGQVERGGLPTPWFASPEQKISFTARIGASAPIFGFRSASVDRQMILDILQFSRKRSNFFVSPSSRKAINDSNAAFALNHSSS